MTPRLLVIAGSDNSGGAGLQADIKTASALGVYAMSAVTAVTVQDTHGVHAIHPVPADIVREQIRTCLNDIGADAIKIGMLASDAIATAVADALVEFSGIPLVIDPVLASTSGAVLLGPEALHTLKTRLFPRALLVTPNIPETETLTGIRIETFDDMRIAADEFASFGVAQCAVQGWSCDSSDSQRHAGRYVKRPDHAIRIATHRHTAHSMVPAAPWPAAIACGLAQKLSLTDSVRRAHDFVQHAIRTSAGFRQGARPPQSSE